MALCRIILMDFLDGEQVLSSKGYDSYDLENGIAYAESCKEYGLPHEPFWRFDLDEFIAWCGSLNGDCAK